MSALTCAPFAGCCIPIGNSSSQQSLDSLVLTTLKSRGLLLRLAPSSSFPSSNDRYEARVESVATQLLGDEYSFLFPALPRMATSSGHGILWFARRTAKQPTGTSWDDAHAELARLRAQHPRLFAEGDIEVLIEPDLDMANVFDIDRWCWDRSKLSGSSVLVGEAYNSDWPTDTTGDLTWHLGPTRTELLAARDATANSQASIRIGILDTGYDPIHVTKPKYVDVAYERDFVEDVSQGTAPAATDPGTPLGGGLLCNNGHGTATLALLAGTSNSVDPKDPISRADGDFGGAPGTVVVPIRIANSVVHLWSSAMAQGIRYASEAASPTGAGCDVISISAGGLPTSLWADVVNSAYDRGVIVVAATGDNFHDFPVRGTVWPARFGRVVAVAGATAKNEPYSFPYSRTPNKIMMEGSFGPPHVMTHAIGSWAPNTPWAHWLKGISGDPHRVVDLNGGGTSASTPQVAAACALWLASKEPAARHPGEPWQRVAAARQALFGSAQPYANFSNEFGAGLLKANQMLTFPVPERLQKTPEDSVHYPILEALLGIDGSTPEGAMLSLEAAQLAASNRAAERLIPDWDLQDGTTSAKQADVARLGVAFRAVLSVDTRASRSLRSAIASTR